MGQTALLSEPDVSAQPEQPLHLVVPEVGLEAVTGAVRAIEITKHQVLIGGYDEDRIKALLPDARERETKLLIRDKLSNFEKVPRKFRPCPEYFEELAAEAKREIQTILDKVNTYEFKDRDNFIFALKLALDESVANHLVHGNRWDPRKTMSIEVKIAHEGNNLLKVEVTSQDQGKGFDISKVSDPTSEENLERESGRGILLMKAYSAEHRSLNGGTTSWLQFNAPQE